MSDKPIKHAKITTTTIRHDGKFDVQTDTYHEMPTGITQSIMQHIRTTRHGFIADIIDAVGVVSNKVTRELTLHITVDDQNEPTLITQTYVTNKEHYPKRK